MDPTSAISAFAVTQNEGSQSRTPWQHHRVTASISFQNSGVRAANDSGIARDPLSYATRRWFLEHDDDLPLARPNRESRAASSVSPWTAIADTKPKIETGHSSAYLQKPGSPNLPALRDILRPSNRGELTDRAESRLHEYQGLRQNIYEPVSATNSSTDRPKQVPGNQRCAGRGNVSLLRGRLPHSNTGGRRAC